MKKIFFAFYILDRNAFMSILLFDYTLGFWIHHGLLYFDSTTAMARTKYNRRLNPDKRIRE